MKKIIGIVAVVLIVAVLAGVLGYLTEGFKNWTFSDVLSAEENQEKIGELEIVAESNEYIDLVISDYKGPLMASPGGLPALDSRVVTATIFPAEATNKAVDWSVTWVTPNDGFAVGKTVTEYVNVFADYDGSLTAVVECYQSFEDEVIHVVCTTRDGGFNAYASITFSGRPTEFSLDHNLNWIDATESVAGYYQVSTNSTYTIPISLDNAYSSVKSSYYDKVSCEVVGLGKIILQDFSNPQGGSPGYVNEMKTVELNSLVSNFISVSYDNGNLIILTKKSVESYFGPGSNAAFEKDKFKSYVADPMGYRGHFRISVGYNGSLEGGENIEKSIFVKIAVPVQNAAISPMSFEF